MTVSPDHQPLGQFPRISPSLIERFDTKNRNLREDFKALQKTNPQLATRIMVLADRARANGGMEAKESYVRGALYMYALLAQQLEVAALGALFLESAVNDGGDDVDQQPSV